MIVVADTSVLINLCRVRQGGLLRLLFRDVVIPPEVANEFLRLTTAVPRFTGLTLPDEIRWQRPSLVIPAVQAAGLDAGESAALGLLQNERTGGPVLPGTGDIGNEAFAVGGG